MGLKFFLQAKQRARLVAGLVAVSNPWQRGHSKEEELVWRKTLCHGGNPVY